MRRLDVVTSCALALLAGLLYASWVRNAAGFMLGLAPPVWYAQWANANPVAALIIWDLGLALVLYVLPSALGAWLLVRVARIRTWHCLWLGSAVAVLWLVVWPLLEHPGVGVRMTMEWSDPVLLRYLAQFLFMTFTMPLLGWLYARRRGSRRAG